MLKLKILILNQDKIIFQKIEKYNKEKYIFYFETLENLKGGYKEEVDIVLCNSMEYSTINFIKRNICKNILLILEENQHRDNIDYNESVFDFISKPFTENELVYKFQLIGKYILAEKIAQENKMRFNTLLNNVPYMAWFKNEDSKYIVVNDEFKEHCGKNYERIYGQDDYFVWEGVIGEKCRLYDIEVMEKRKQIVFDEVIPGRKGYKEFNIYKVPVIDENNKVKGTMGIARDITDLKNKDEKFKILIENIPFPVYMKDIAGRIVTGNDKFLEMFNLNKGVYKYLQEEDFLGIEFKEDIKNEDLSVIRGKKGINIIKKIKDDRVLDISKAPVSEISEEVIGIVCILRDITDLKNQEEKIKNLAYTDSLTKLANRRGLYQYIENEMLLKEINKITIMFIDLDNFKYLNDSFGHFYADNVLNYFATRLKEICKDGFISRMGGDEFVIVWENLINKDFLIEKAEEILDILSAKNKNGKLTRVSASIGIVVGNINEEENIDSLLMKGDLALYKAKEQGKNQYVFYNKYLDQKRCLDLDIEQELRNALDKNELVLYYQPQYNLNRKLVGFEALLRWHNEKFKHIPIIEVIKIMEKYNLIDDIGRFITRSAMEFSRKINENRKRNIVISINISSIQIMKNNFVRKIKKYLGEIGADPKNIGLEITETVLLQNIEENIEKIKELRDIGVKISLDDFGTGYSSFSYLVKLPLNNIKIDKSFVKGMTEAEEYKKLIKLTVDTARALKLNVVGEGVETERDFEILKEIGIDYIQGYLFSKPIPEKEAMELLMKEK